MDQARRQQLAEKGRRLYDRFCRKNDDACVLGFVDHQLAQAAGGSVVDDLLAYLAEQMVAMENERQQRVAAFWLDLGRVTAPADYGALRQSQPESSLWQAEACRPYVAAESGATRTLDEALAWSEDGFNSFVRLLGGGADSRHSTGAVYRRHASAFALLVDRIRRTERLIARVVARRSDTPSEFA